MSVKYYDLISSSSLNEVIAEVRVKKIYTILFIGSVVVSMILCLFHDDVLKTFVEKASFSNLKLISADDSSELILLWPKIFKNIDKIDSKIKLPNDITDIVTIEYFTKSNYEAKVYIGRASPFGPSYTLLIKLFPLIEWSSFIKKISLQNNTILAISFCKTMLFPGYYKIENEILLNDIDLINYGVEIIGIGNFANRQPYPYYVMTIKEALDSGVCLHFLQESNILNTIHQQLYNINTINIQYMKPYWSDYLSYFGGYMATLGLIIVPLAKFCKSRNESLADKNLLINE